MKAILLSCLLLISNTGFAEDTGYEVELIIFEDTTELYKNSENWLPAEKSSIKGADLNKSEGKIESLNNDKKVAFEFINDEDHRLNKQVEKLQTNSRYNVLFHKAWKQRGLDKKSAIPLSINTQDSLISTTDTPSKAATDVNSNIIKSKSFITGNFTLIMSRYLHVISELTLNKPARGIIPSANGNSEDTENKSTASKRSTITEAYDKYPLLFKRRMRSKEIHYIDHPLGGMIVLATPYKIKEEGDEENKSVKGYKTL
jgi:Peptidoglycan-binding protein, CsiV